MNKRKLSSVFFLLLNVVLLTISLYFLLIQYSAKNWETVAAEIIMVEPRCCRSRSEKKSIYIQYKFVFEDEIRISDAISFSPLDINVYGEREFRVTSKYKVGDKVIAYVSGSDSILELGVNSYVILLFLLSLGMFMYGIKKKIITMRFLSVAK
jgi:hypothetical protein